MRRVFAQARKELIELLRDRLALALVLVLPLIQLALMGSAFALTVHDLPLVVQDLDNTPASRRLIDAFRGSLTFRIVAWPTDRHPEDALPASVARGVLVIPPQFGHDLARGRQAAVQLLVDGSDGNTAKLIAGYSSGVIRAFNTQLAGGSVESPVEAACGAPLPAGKPRSVIAPFVPDGTLIARLVTTPALPTNSIRLLPVVSVLPVAFGTS